MCYYGGQAHFLVSMSHAIGIPSFTHKPTLGDGSSSEQQVRAVDAHMLRHLAVITDALQYFKYLLLCRLHFITLN